jgi:hypothetical protein
VTKWPYELVGAGYGILGIGFIVGAHLRTRSVDAALRRGEFAEPDTRIMNLVLAAGVLLGIASVVLVLFVS